MTVSKKNNTWGYDFRHGSKRYRKQGFATKREASAAELEAKSKVSKGMDITSNITFVEYFKKWYAVHKADVSLSTLNSYDTAHKWIAEYFGSTMLKDITRTEYQAFINWYGITAKSKLDFNVVGHSYASVKKLNGYIRTCVSDAIFEGVIFKDFTHKVNLVYTVEEKTEDEKFINLNEYKKIKEYMESKSTLSSLFILMMIVTGGRYSDIFNSRYEYFNEIQSTVYLNGTKNANSKRTVKIPEKDMQIILEKINDMPRNLSGYVFDGYRGIITVDAINKALTKCCKELGIRRITSHVLRHTHCSMLIHEGVDIYYISKRLGHRSVLTTQSIYAHLLKESHDKAEEQTIRAIANL